MITHKIRDFPGVARSLYEYAGHEQGYGMMVCKLCGKRMRNNGFPLSAHAKMHVRKNEAEVLGRTYFYCLGEDPSLEALGESLVRYADDTVVDRNTNEPLTPYMQSYYLTEE